MEVNIKAIGAIITSMDTVNTNGMMAETISEAGKTACSTAKVYIHGTTEENTKASTKKIKNTDKASILGQRAKNTMVAGSKTSSMEKPLSQIPKGRRKEVFGSMVKGNLGLNENFKSFYRNFFLNIENYYKN